MLDRGRVEGTTPCKLCGATAAIKSERPGSPMVAFSCVDGQEPCPVIVLVRMDGVPVALEAD